MMMARTSPKGSSREDYMVRGTTPKELHGAATTQLPRTDTW